MKILSGMNSRDRNLLILLAAIIIFYLCYTFVMVPSLERAQVLGGEIESATAEITRAEDMAGKEEELKKQEEILRAELLEKYAEYFVELDQANILNKFDSLMTGTGFTITSYTPSEVTISQVLTETGVYTHDDYPLLNLAKSIDPELHLEEHPEQTGSDVVASEDSQDRIPCLEVTINYDGPTYETVVAFLDAVERMDKTVVIKSLDFGKADEGAGLQGQIILNLYRLPRFDQSQTDELEFTPTAPRGKANPFQ